MTSPATVIKSGVLPLRNLLRRAVLFRVCRLELAVLAAMAANARQRITVKAPPPAMSAQPERGTAAPMLSAAAARATLSSHAEHGVDTADGFGGSAACALRAVPAYATPEEQPGAGLAARLGAGTACALSPGPGTLPEQPGPSTAEGSDGRAYFQNPAPACGSLDDEQAVSGVADRLSGGATCAVSPGPAPRALDEDPSAGTAEGVGGIAACPLSPMPAPTALGEDPGGATAEGLGAGAACAPSPIHAPSTLGGDPVEGAPGGLGGGAALSPAPASRTLDGDSGAGAAGRVGHGAVCRPSPMPAPKNLYEDPGAGAAGRVGHGAVRRLSPMPAPRNPGSARMAAAFAAWQALTVRQWRRRAAAAAPMARRTEWRCA